MTTDLIQHLINVKIYADYKRSKLDSFELFISYIDDGNNLSDLEKETTLFVDDDFEPSTEEIHQFKNQPERNYIEEYINMIKYKIEQILDYHNTPIPNLFEINKIVDYVRSIEGLEAFLNLKDKQTLIDEYIVIIKSNHPDKFIESLTTVENDLNNFPLLTNPHPNIFPSIRGYKIFSEFQEKFIKHEHADYSFIYRRMISDKLIVFDLGDQAYRNWLYQSFDIDINKTKTFKEVDLSDPSKRDRIYFELKRKYN
ncbi:hypothetical protein [Joostella sp.]|uniref:hypothetical protein n=1 Tax=Joostella sp. TaxID=2231138 RepID=UPI003A93814D